MRSELLDRLFTQDHLVEAEFWNSLTSHNLLGEHKLQLEVLWDAVQILTEKKKSPPWRRAQYDETLLWMMHRGMEHPFTLDYICQSLGFNPGSIRKGLVRIATRKLDLVKTIAL